MGLLGGVPNKKERTKRLLAFSIAGFGQPENVDCEQESTQTFSISKLFSVRMLDIRDMSEKDKLFSFLEGSKPWAEAELQRRGVLDLASAKAMPKESTFRIELLALPLY